MSAETRPIPPVSGAVAPGQPFAAGILADQLEDAGPRPDWLWQGYLAPGNLTLLTAQWKTGKSTLMSVLLARLKEGGELAGLRVTPGKAVILSEESRLAWARRHRKLGLDHVVFFCRPFRRRPRLDEWSALLDHVADLHRQRGLSLVVVDTLAAFLPGGNESNAAAVVDALQPLQKLAELGLSILVLHHPRKGLVIPGQAPRGTGALPAFANISVEMYLCNRADAQDRRRQLLGFSHHEETPRQLVLELNAEGTDYQAVDAVADDDFLEHWEQLRLVLEGATHKWTRREILEEWSNDFPRPAGNTLWRWLKRAVALNLLGREGSGRPRDPFVYWLPEAEARWRADPVLDAMERAIEQSRLERRQQGPNNALSGATAPVPLQPAAEPGPEPPSPAPTVPAADAEAAPPAATVATRGLHPTTAAFLRPYLPGSRPPSSG